MNDIKLKHILRNLKQQEIRLRSGIPVDSLVYASFFGGSNPHYPFSLLNKMDDNAFRIVTEEYWAEVLYEYFRTRGFYKTLNRDPALLKVLGLPHGTSDEDIKKRFRQLAQRLHPDHGGDAQRFIKIRDAYDKLKRK